MNNPEKWVKIPVDGEWRYRCGNIECCRLIPKGPLPDKCPYCNSSHMPKDDLISRSEAIEAVRSLTVFLGGEQIFHPEAKASVISAINDLPARKEE